MSNIHLWQYIVIAGPAAVLGGLVVWALNREYVRGLEDALLSEPDQEPKAESVFVHGRRIDDGPKTPRPNIVPMPQKPALAIMDDCPGSIVTDEGVYRVEHKDHPIEVRFDSPSYAEALVSYMMKQPRKQGGPL